MEQVAFLVGDRFFYWSSIILTLAATVSILLFLGLYLQEQEHIVAAAWFLPLAAGLSLVLARLVHWYSLTDHYRSLSEAMTQFDRGGYALPGVVAGVLLAAVILKLLKVLPDLPELLDCLSIAGAAGIAVGRLASFYNGSDRGMVLPEEIPFPWVYPVVNAVTGNPEYRLATFALQAILAAVMAVGLSWFYRRNWKRASYCPGDTALLFALFYGASEVVMDSTRYDSLYFRSNGFVSMVQVLGAVALVASLVVFSRRMVKRQGFRKMLHLSLWGGILGCMGLAGYMEYYVQRHASAAAMAYSVMGLCLLAVCAAAWYIRYLAQVKE